MKASKHIKNYLLKILFIGMFFMFAAIFTDSSQTKSDANGQKQIAELVCKLRVATTVESISLPGYNKNWVSIIDILNVKFENLGFAKMAQQLKYRTYFSVFQKKRLQIKPKLLEQFFHSTHHLSRDNEPILS
jgi:hypothetical protein